MPTIACDVPSPAYADVVYRGDPVGDDGEPVVLIEAAADGELLGQVVHVVTHSPSGVSWGYLGSGPSDLARSLLIAALAAVAVCRTCRGAREVVWTVDGVIRRDPRQHSEEESGVCVDCDRDGYRRDLPYQAFKEAYVARWPWPQPWSLRRSELLAWLSIQGVRAECPS